VGSFDREKMIKNIQSGRSMIEMLGVLAIVGVLSVGGLAGYSMAIERHKINETTSQIDQLILDIADLYVDEESYASLDNDVIADARLLPETMISGSTITNSFNGLIEFKGTDSGYAVIYNFPDGAANMCIKMLKQGWFDRLGSDLAAIKIAKDDLSWSSHTAASGDLPLDLSAIGTMCSAFVDGDDFNLMLAISDASII
jgi:Tfp pilus assembly protein PilE